MWLGFIVGVFYALTGFRGEGKPPRLACTCGPFRKGMLFYRGVHIHHWMLCAPVSIVAVLVGAWNFASFCAVMTLHGISYTDAFDACERNKTRDMASTEAATSSSPPPQRAHTPEPTELEIRVDDDALA